MQSSPGEVYKVLNTQKGRGLHHAVMAGGGVQGAEYTRGEAWGRTMQSWLNTLVGGGAPCSRTIQFPLVNSSSKKYLI